ncbi:MAG: ankyrin repeat domain-containing protein [Sulfuritalea sp.]|nr:ankyrin repeat domain-containing protein [Sulfuritalea sp.]
MKKKNIDVSVDSLAFYASQGDLATTRLLLDAGVTLNAKTSRGSLPLVDASWAGKQDAVLQLLDAKADVNATSAGQLTALSSAVKQKHGKRVELLLERGANPNIADATGGSPLMDVAWQGDVVLVNALLKKGAATDTKRATDRLTALKAAAAANKTEVVQVLKTAGARE